MNISPIFYTALLTGLSYLCANDVSAQKHYIDRTLRVDYIFSGDALHQEIALDEMATFDGWYGRQTHMDSLFLRGNGQITMRDKASGTVIYRTSFSSLFQEWQGTPEAQNTRRAFENVFLLPMPADKAEIEVTLYGFHGNVTGRMSHMVDPGDILIRTIGADEGRRPAVRFLHRGGDPHRAIDVAILPEGYTAEEMPAFRADAFRAMEALFRHAPFGELKDRFNIMAIELPSEDSGVSIPGRGEWKHTALGSHFNTFYSDRYLTTLRLRHLHDALAGLPYEHIIILANTKTYGGGGIYNSYTLTTAGHEAFEPVVVHEFGHSFAGLADEYVEGGFADFYDTRIEPWEQNITTLADFSSKWKSMLPHDTDIPTPVNRKMATYELGVIEGAGYQAKGVYRACEDCRMRTNSASAFCPVCQRAIRRLIEFYTE